MSDKTPLEKLRLKSGMSAALLHIPADLVSILELPEGVSASDDPARADFVLEFAASQAEAEARITALAPSLAEKKVAWIGYPKGSKAAGYDLNRDTIFAFARTVGLVLVANFAINQEWSALRIRPARPGE